MKTSQEDNGFRQRLSLVLGRNKPYAWARKIGLPPATFDRIWQQGGLPRAETLLLIARKTGVDLHWLLTGHRPRPTGVGEFGGYPHRDCGNQGEGSTRLDDLDHSELSEEEGAEQAVAMEQLLKIHASGDREMIELVARLLATCNELLDRRRE